MHPFPGDEERAPENGVLQEICGGFLPLLGLGLFALNDFADGFRQLGDVALLDVFFDAPGFLEFLIIIAFGVEKYNDRVVRPGLQQPLGVGFLFLEAEARVISFNFMSLEGWPMTAPSTIWSKGKS